MSSDPAVEAADRAWAAKAPGILKIGYHMENAAREALKPIRYLHTKTDYFDGDDGSYEFTCAHCDGLWPCETAKLVYSAEELS